MTINHFDVGSSYGAELGDGHIRGRYFDGSIPLDTTPIIEKYGFTKEELNSDLGAKILGVAVWMTLPVNPYGGMVGIALEDVADNIARRQVAGTFKGLSDSYRSVITEARDYGARVTQELLDLVEL